MKKLSTRQLLIIVLVIDIILCGVFILINFNQKKTTVDRQISESSIQRICELATLDCFYHNVSEWSKSGNWIGYGAKKLWIEYDGIVRVGIKANKIKISDPDKNDVITVTMPAATILDKDLDENSIYEIDSESPMWGFVPFYESVSTEERREALANAQEDMESSAAKNDMILDEALVRAKKIIEKNIVTIGEAGGKHYKVKFIDASETQSVPTEEVPQ
ncbi:MAG: DUF4230 domain-containing protein [Clostridia bacterium]|nr:DUF4230 domain-containing protein [Clostridia bacterium]